MKKIILTLSFIALFANQALAQSLIKATNPKDYATELGNIITNLVQSKKTDSEKQEQLIELFKINADTDYMAKFVMGKYFKQLDEKQKKKYLELYREFVIFTYIPRFREYEGETQNVLSAIDQGQGEYQVKTTITSKKAKNGKVSVDYRVKKYGSSFKVIDVIGEGVSLLTTQRSDFAAPISQKGIDFFLERLAEKVKKQKSFKWENKTKK